MAPDLQKTTEEDFVRTLTKQKHFASYASEFGDRFSRDSLLSRAASLAYYTTLAIAPFTVITLICLSLLGPGIVGVYTREVTKFLGPQAGSVFVTAVASTKDRPDLGTLTGLISVITLLISASAVFGELRETLNRIHRIDVSPPKKETWRTIVSSFLMTKVLNAGLVLGFIFILVTSLVLSSVVSLLSAVLPGELTWMINWLGSGVAYVLTFTLLSRYVPSRALPWRDAVRGGLITGAFFLVGKELLSNYLGSESIATAYGAAGSLVIFLLWVYYSATILFACAELNELFRIRAEERRKRKVSMRRSSSAKNWNRLKGFVRRPVSIVLAAVVLALVGVRMWLPGKIRDTINSSLAANERSIGGFVEDVDLAIYRGAYRLEGLRLFLIDQKQGPRRVLAASADAVDISISWRDLFRGRIRADVDLELPKIMLEPLVDFAKILTKPGMEEPKGAAKILVPFNLARLRVHGGHVDTGLLKGGMQPLLEDIEAEATGLYDTAQANGTTSKISLVGRVTDGGDLSAQGELTRGVKEEPIQWSGIAHVNRFPLPRLNALLLEYVPLSFTTGALTVNGQFRGSGTDLKGQVTTNFEKVDVISSKETWNGPKHALFELGSALAFILTKNPGDRETVASFDFERLGGDFKINYGEAFRSALKHRFTD